MCLWLALCGAQGAAHAAGLEAQVTEAARRAVLELADREGWVAPDVQIAAPAAKPRPACAPGWDIVAQDLRSLSRLRFSARCAGQPNQDFVLRAGLSAEVLVATQNIPAGRALGEADVELQRRDLGQASDALGRTEDVLGQAPRSSLRPGQILQKRQLLAAQLVRRGDRVRILARHEGIEVQAPGEALEAGARDARIKVRNSNSGRVITARVLEPGLVEPAER
ncbi:flagellar basal body P-ring formation protein FlgA [Roseateles sp. DAIF2]|uniref:flagellar basal body P-ring formation chaperone FlgA n=1 Tax=Roseateles sp. DAIF2 TaxID=2714952 RepID=UPI0018A25F82|nr:flagellar basal body P-ring formation chaperone FlgA [Roseateles sp. DAIF2]QPF74155.1 flagellar basal body P-ring formation protein FlgA [Roseateles sp. DAIF2]